MIFNNVYKDTHYAPSYKLTHSHSRPKGRMSPKLSADERLYFDELDELADGLGMLAMQSRHWFEEEDEFELRLKSARTKARASMKVKKGASAGGGKKKAASNGGWSSVAKKSSKPNYKLAAKKRNTTGFGALDSDSD